jgi:hypothetical protein
MSAVDVPQHQGLGGRVAGEFGARRGPRLLAGIAARWVLIAGSLAAALAARRPFHPEADTIVVATLMFAGFAAVGLAVRRARVSVDASGVRWGWSWLGFRLERDTIRHADIYRDAVALRPRRGSTWYLSARDWDRWDALALAVERSGLTVIRHGDRGAPFGARLQSYGRVLDGLLLLTIAGSTLLVVLAASL